MRISDWSSDVCSSDLWSPTSSELPRRRSGPLPGVAAKHPATHKGSVPAGSPARCAKGRAAGIPGWALRRRAWARERSARRSSGPVQHHFAALPRQHGIKPVLELAGAKAMRNDGRYIEPALQHGDHFVPGLEHFAAIDAFDLQPFENNLAPVHAKRSEEHTSELQSLMR